MRTGYLLFFVLQCPASAEWVFGAYLGASYTADTTLTLRQPALNTAISFSGVRFAGRSFASPVYYGYRAAYFWTERVGVEGEFIHLKVYGEVARPAAANGIVRGAPLAGAVPVSRVISRFNISHGVNPVLANLVLRQGFGSAAGPGRRRLYLGVRVGAGITVPHPESTVLGDSEEHYEFGRPAMHVASGGELRVWKGLFAIAEYKFTRTRQRVTVASGTAETLLLSHHVAFGLSWHR